MPARVVVVKRSRRRVFAIVRGAPAWLRAFAATVRLRGRWSRRAAGGPEPADLKPAEGLRLPRLVDGASLDGCAECSRCVEVCPSSALALESVGPDTATPQLRLDPGRCIGCGDCARLCPSDLLEMAASIAAVGVGSCPATRLLLPGAASAVGP